MTPVFYLYLITLYNKYNTYNNTMQENNYIKKSPISRAFFLGYVAYYFVPPVNFSSPKVDDLA